LTLALEKKMAVPSPEMEASREATTDWHAVRITTDPAGAEIEIDGADAGRSPLEVAIPGRLVKISADLDGHLKRTQKILVSKPTQLEMELMRTPWQRHWGHAAFWLGLGFVGFGGIATWQSHQAGLDANRDASSAWAGTMYASYGLGLALMVTGITLWCISPGYSQFDSE